MINLREHCPAFQLIRIVYIVNIPIDMLWAHFCETNRQLANENVQYIDNICVDRNLIASLHRFGQCWRVHSGFMLSHYMYNGTKNIIGIGHLYQCLPKKGTLSQHHHHQKHLKKIMKQGNFDLRCVASCDSSLVSCACLLTCRVLRVHTI